MVFLCQSYYLSTAPANYKGGAPRIVVRAGHPSLKFIPGFNDVLVDTGFSTSDLEKENATAVDAFPRETLSGLRSQRTNGYSSWANNITAAMPTADAGRTYRLLGQREQARDTLRKLLADKPYESLAFSLGTLAKAAGTEIKPAFLQSLKDVSGKSEKHRVLFTLAFSELAKDGVPVPNELMLSLHELLDITRGAITVTKDRDRSISWETSAHMAALSSLAQSSPNHVTEKEVQFAVSLYLGENFDVFAKRQVVDVLRDFGAANPTSAETVLPELLKIIVSEKFGSGRKNGTGWLTDDAIRAAAALGHDYPKSITKAAIDPLCERMKGDDGRMLGAGAILFSHLASANPSSADSEVIQKLSESLGRPSSPIFSAGDFSDPKAIVRKLREASDPVSKFLWDGFAPPSRQVLTDESSLAKQQQTALADELNKVLRGPLLHNPQRFAGIELSEDVQALVTKKAQGDDLIRLNRLLLEAAYPDEISDYALHETFERNVCAIALTRLAAKSLEWKNSSAIKRCWDILKSPAESESSRWRRNAASALLEFASVDEATAKQLPVLIEECIRPFRDKGASGSSDEEEFRMDFFLSKAGRLRADAVTTTAVNMQIEAMENPVWSGQDAESAHCLIALAKFAPDPILGAKQRLYQQKIERLSPSDINHELIRAVLARATYESLRKAKDPSPETKLLQLIQWSLDDDERVFGAYGLLFLALDDSASVKRFTPPLQKLASDPQPQTRIAANRALEMVRVAQLVDEAKHDRRLVPLNKSKLRLLRSHPEIHLGVAGQVCLEEL